MELARPVEHLPQLDDVGVVHLQGERQRAVEGWQAHDAVEGGNRRQWSW